MISAGYVFLSEQEPVDLLTAPLQHLTHLIVSFADVSPELTAVWQPCCAPQALRSRFPGLKVLLAVGGWTWSGRFSDAARTPASRREFALSALRLMQEHGFDGFDLDWEFPVVGGLAENVRRPEDSENFTLLLEELRRTFDAAEPALGRLLLTVATGANRPQVEALETDTFHRHIDWMNLMTYDYHGNWNPAPGDNSSLADTEASVRLHLDRGFPAAKIVVGTPLYGHQWLKEGPGWKPGPVLLWNQAEALRTPQNFVWDHARGASRLEDPTRVVTWDSQEALAAKADLVHRLSLGGLMTWQVTGDLEGRQLARLAP